MSALGLMLAVVTVRDFSGSATCYAQPNDRVRPEADGSHHGAPRVRQCSIENKYLPGSSTFMAQITRAFIAFVVAPAIPGALLYIYGLLKGYADAAVVGPFILTFLGYIAELIIGVPMYLLLERKGIRSLAAYVLIGALIGPIFYLVFEILTAYPGQLIFRLQHALGASLVAAGYSSVAAATFWLIAGQPKRIAP